MLQGLGELVRLGEEIGKTCLALPGCLAAVAASMLVGSPTTTRATMPSQMRLAADAIDAVLLEGDGDLFVHLAREGFSAGFLAASRGWSSALWLLSVGTNYRIARRDLDDRRLEHHRARRALVEHLDLDFGGCAPAAAAIISAPARIVLSIVLLLRRSGLSALRCNATLAGADPPQIAITQRCGRLRQSSRAQRRPSRR